MKEGSRHQRTNGGADDEDDFEFETNNDGESYHKNQIHSYANASNWDKYALFRGSSSNNNANDNNKNNQSGHSKINPNNTYDTYKNTNA